MVGVFQRFRRQSTAENPNSSGPCQEVEEPGLHHPSCRGWSCFAGGAGGLLAARAGTALPTVVP